MELGIIGGAILVSAWIYETYISYKQGKKFDIKFICLYLVGISFITLYTYQINDMPLFALNSSILLLTLIEFELALRQRHSKLYGKKGLK